VGQTAPLDFRVSPLTAAPVNAWLKLEKTLLTVVKKPGGKLPNGKPMDAEQTKALFGDVTILMQKIGPLAPKLTTKLLMATSVDTRKTMLADLEKVTAAATKQLVDFRKVGGSHTAVGRMLFTAMDNLHTDIAGVHRTYVGYSTGRIPLPGAKR
jgi:hypothetical protein